jgi:hypothetical protein
MEFVKVQFTVQVRVDSHGDVKVPGNIIRSVEHGFALILGQEAQLTVDGISRIQLPALSVEETI